MTWTAPKTWSANELVRSTDFNTYISDNLDYLFTRPYAMQRVAEASDYSTTSTTFVDIDATDLSKDVEIASGRALILFIGSFSPSNNLTMDLDIAVDGTRLGLDNGIVRQMMELNQVETVPVLAVVTGLSAGSHTFKVQWKTSGNTLTMEATTNHSYFFVMEF